MKSISRAKEIVRRCTSVANVMGHVEEYSEDLHEGMSENHNQNIEEKTQVRVENQEG